MIICRHAVCQYVSSPVTRELLFPSVTPGWRAAFLVNKYSAIHTTLFNQDLETLRMRDACKKGRRKQEREMQEKLAIHLCCE